MTDARPSAAARGVLLALGLVACSDASMRPPNGPWMSQQDASTDSGHQTTSGAGAAGSTGGSTGGADSGQTGGQAGDRPALPACAATPIDSAPKCTTEPRPASFRPDVQWTWNGDEARTNSVVIPLVLELTDDNNDGNVDLCDVPDVVVVAYDDMDRARGFIYALDGATGALHYRSEAEVSPLVTPAAAEIDGEPGVEIVTFDPDGKLIAFGNDGTVRWHSDGAGQSDFNRWGAIALADLDNDGRVEIMAGARIYDDRGVLLVELADKGSVIGHASAPLAADLDDDGDLEVVLGRSAYHHDGTPVFERTDRLATGYPQTADLDSDGQPEIVLVTEDGYSIIEHDGQLRHENVRPMDIESDAQAWRRPACIHDFDGDTIPEIAVSVRDHYSALRPDLSIVWSASVADFTGTAAGTAFDFLGDGTAEAMYADETMFFVFDEHGQALLEIPRSSGTLIEYPVVADVDNDGSAEIVVVSAVGIEGEQTAPTVQVIRDSSDQWIQARRIWNQHTYHVTNVEEDGSIPQYELPHWKHFNTFRTNAQIESGGVCLPVVY